MPDLFDVANHFDDTPIYDGYSGAYLFDGQFSNFDNTAPDGSVTRRRVLSLAPSLTPPARGVIQYFNERWIIGTGNVDGIYGAIIRRTFWMKKATDLMAKLTPTEACNASAGSSFYAFREYLKDTVNAASDADYDPFWTVSLSTGESVQKGHFLRFTAPYGTTLARVRSVHESVDGLLMAECDEIDAGALVTVTIGSQTYNPVTDTYSGSTVNTPGLLLDRYKLFKLQTDMDAKEHPGDKTLIVPNTATIAVGSKLVVGSQTWTVLTKTSELDAWMLHVRL